MRLLRENPVPEAKTLKILPFLMILAVLWGCTEANLYHRDRSPAQADRVTLRGEVCTDDPMVNHFPLKVVFVVDQSNGFNPFITPQASSGTLFTTFDPEYRRIRAIVDLITEQQDNPNVSFAVVGYGGSIRVLAPEEGSFTRTSEDLLEATQALSAPQPCEGASACRDLRGALGTARSLIEGDITDLSPGARAMTRYVIILLNAGPQSPRPDGILYCQRAIGPPASCDPTTVDCVRDLRANICCPLDQLPCVALDPGALNQCYAPGNVPAGYDCVTPPPNAETLVIVEDVRLMRDELEQMGIGSFALHAMHLMAEDETLNPGARDSMRDLMTNMAFAGGGIYQEYTSGEALNSEVVGIGRLGLLRPVADLEAKDFYVFNLNALPGYERPVTDTDGDGLPDSGEEEHGTDPSDPDTDGDGITDYVEVLVQFSPLSPDRPIACEDIIPFIDSDGDFLTDCDEEMLGTDPSLIDSDGDAIPDKLELVMGTDYVEIDWLNDLDEDGVHNGDEVRGHSDPRTSDASSHLATHYRYDIEDLGIVARLEPIQPVRLTGVHINSAGADTAYGSGLLCYYPPPSGTGIGGHLCWFDPNERTDAGEPMFCSQCDPTNPGLPGNPIRISDNGTYVLPSPSDGERVIGEDGETLVMDRTIEVEVAVIALPPENSQERILINRYERQCISFVVRNVRLAPTEETVDIPQTGWNNIALYFAQAPDGRLDVPGLFRTAMIPVRFIPPARREPSDAEIMVWDYEFVGQGSFQ